MGLSKQGEYRKMASSMVKMMMNHWIWGGYFLDNPFPSPYPLWKWRCPKPWGLASNLEVSWKNGVPLVIIHFRWGFSLTKTIQLLGTSPHCRMKTPCPCSCSYWCVSRREWMGMGVARIVVQNYYGSFPHSLRSAPLSFLGTPPWLQNHSMANVRGTELAKVFMKSFALRGPNLSRACKLSTDHILGLVYVYIMYI